MHKRFVSFIRPDLLSWAILSHMSQQSLATLSGVWFSRWIQSLKVSIANWERICQVHLWMQHLVNVCFNLNTTYKKMYTCFLNRVFIPAAIMTFFIDSYHTTNQSITSFYGTPSYLYSRANVIPKCNSSLYFCTRNHLWFKLKSSTWPWNGSTLKTARLHRPQTPWRFSTPAWRLGKRVRKYSVCMRI